jgi:hypothetical protein
MMVSPQRAQGWVAVCLLLTACSGETEVGTPHEEAIEQTVPTSEQAVAEPTEVDPEIDSYALSLLKEMSSKVAGLVEFTVTLETGFDVLQLSGQKLEFGSRRTAKIRRPNLARFTYEERSGLEGELVFDGSNVYAYERDQNVYATIEQPGDIDATVDMMATELGIPVPASDFFAADPGAMLVAGLLEARDLGPSTIDNQPARHVALRKPGVDYQIWINDVTQLPVRTVITYLEEPGQPQFWAQFLNWNTAPEVSRNEFAFLPSEGAELIRFGVFDPTATDEQIP